MSFFKLCEWGTCEKIAEIICTCQVRPYFCCGQHLGNHVNSSPESSHSPENILTTLSEEEIQIVQESLEKSMQSEISKVIHQMKNRVSLLQQQIKDTTKECKSKVQSILHSHKQKKIVIDTIKKFKKVTVYTENPLVVSITQKKLQENISEETLQELLPQIDEYTEEDRLIDEIRIIDVLVRRLEGNFFNYYPLDELLRQNIQGKLDEDLLNRLDKMSKTDLSLFFSNCKSLHDIVYTRIQPEFVFEIKKHKNSVTSVDLCKETIASASIDNSVKLWSRETGEIKLSLSGHTLAVLCVVFSRCAEFVASGSYDKSVRIWNAKSGVFHMKLLGHANAVISVSFSPCGEFLVSASWDWTIKQWDWKRGLALSTLKGHTDKLMSVDYSPCGNFIASASKDKTVKLWAGENNIHNFVAHNGSVNCVVFSSCGSTVVTGGNDALVKVWDIHQGILKLTLKGHLKSVLCVKLFGKIIASTGEAIILWKFEDGEKLKYVKTHCGPVRSIVFSSNGRELVSGGDDKAVIKWKLF